MNAARLGSWVSGSRSEYRMRYAGAASRDCCETSSSSYFDTRTSFHPVSTPDADSIHRVRCVASKPVSKRQTLRPLISVSIDPSMLWTSVFTVLDRWRRGLSRLANRSVVCQYVVNPEAREC